MISSIPPNAKRVCPDPGVFTCTRVTGLVYPPIALSSMASLANLPSNGVVDTDSPDTPLSAEYKFVGDIDKNVRPSFQRHELKGQSMHYFHGYALRDRINLHDLPDATPRSLPEPACSFRSVFLE